ncbi:putative ATPase subunit gpP of terminase [Rahnella sp. BIGb0236]|nr:putative ATPase subunit gpP of terminase [Rahnella sp. BIGb0236]
MRVDAPWHNVDSRKISSPLVNVAVMKMTNSILISDPRRQAALLYWQGFSVRQIAETLTQKIPTVQSWKTRDAWENAAPISRVESSLEARLIQLTVKDVKGNADYKEMEALGRLMERLARVTAASGGQSPNILEFY